MIRTGHAGLHVCKDPPDEPRIRSAPDTLRHRCQKHLRQEGIAAEKPGLQHGCPCIMGTAMQRKGLVQRPHAVPDIQTGIPEEMKEVFDCAMEVLARTLRIDEHHDVDVGVRTEFAPAIPSCGKNRAPGVKRSRHAAGKSEAQHGIRPLAQVRSRSPIRLPLPDGRSAPDRAVKGEDS